MIATFCLFLLLQDQSQATSTPAKEPSAPAVLFFSAISSIMDAGPALWDKIGKYQAGNAIQDISTKAVTLDTQKVALHEDLLNNKIASRNDLTERVDRLKATLHDFQITLDKFANEIDKSSKNLGNDLRGAAQIEIRHKGEDLDFVPYAWQPNDPAAQKNTADLVMASIVCTKQIETAISCLANTVKDAKRDSSPDCTKAAIQTQQEACKVLHPPVKH